MLRRGLLALVPLVALLGSAACDPIEVVPDPDITGDSPPVWDESSPGQIVMVEGTAFTLTQTATDPDNDSVTYLLKQKANDAMTINEDTGEINWLPTFSTITECKGNKTFDIQVVARTKPGNEFVDVERNFAILVLGDLDEDGEADVDENNAAVDDDIDGDGLANANEDTVGTDECVADSDGDNVEDGADNCPVKSNPVAACNSGASEQCDDDDDGLGNECDPFPVCDKNDPDEDGVDNCQDNCPEIANPKEHCPGTPQGQMDQCDDDDDGVGDACDPCPNDHINNPDNDADTEGNPLCAFHEDGSVWDNCNGDVDGDGQISEDEMHTGDDSSSPHYNPDQADDDSDDIGDVCDVCPQDATNDEDDDGVCEDVDNCPNLKNDPSDCDGDAGTPDEQCDLDDDNIGDACDSNIDGDCKENDADNCPMIANCEDDNSQIDTDEDGDGDACDDDDDDDEILDVDDNCPVVANPEQTDVDGDDIGFQCDSSVVIPSSLHAAGLAAARVSGAARAGTVALAFESKEDLCNSAEDCPPPGVLVVDADDKTYMARPDGETQNNWLDVGFGAGGELFAPFVSQSGKAYFATLTSSVYGLRRIEGDFTEGVFQNTTPQAEATYLDLPDATTAVRIKPQTGNPGLYHLEDLSGPSGDPKLLKSAGGYPSAVPPLGPFEIPCGKNGCNTSLVASDATTMGPFLGKDGTLYVPFVSASNGEIEVMAYTSSSGGFQGVNVQAGSSTTLLKSTDLVFVAEDPITGTPWYCMRKAGGAQLVHLSGGLADKVGSTSFFVKCSELSFTLSPGGVWFVEGPDPSGNATRLSFWDTNGSQTNAQDVYGPGAAPANPAVVDEELQLHFAGNAVFIQRTTSDLAGSGADEDYSRIQYWAPGQVGAQSIVSSNEFLYEPVISTNSDGWIGIVGRDTPSYGTVQNIVARRYKSGVTMPNAQQATLRTDTPGGSGRSIPRRAWVGPNGEVWGFYLPATGGSHVLSVFPASGMGTPPPATGNGLAQSALDNGARVTFHPNGTLISVLTNRFSGNLRYAVPSSSGTTLADFSPAVAYASGASVVVHDDFLVNLVPITGGGNHWITYSPTEGSYSIAKVESVGGTPTLNVVETGLLGAPSDVQIGPGQGNGKPWFSYERPSGYNIAWINGVGNFDPVVTDSESIEPIYRTFARRRTLWGVAFKKDSGTPLNVCRLPDKEHCWTAIDGTAVDISWNALDDIYVGDDGVANLLWVNDASPPVVTLWRSIDTPVSLDALP